MVYLKLKQDCAQRFILKLYRHEASHGLFATAELLDCLPYLQSTPPLGGFRRNIAIPFGMEKLEWLGYPMVKKFWSCVYSFWHNSWTWQTHGHTLHDSICRAYASHRAAKNAMNRFQCKLAQLVSGRRAWNGHLRCQKVKGYGHRRLELEFRVLAKESFRTSLDLWYQLLISCMIIILLY